MGRVGPVEIVDLQPGAIIDRFGLPYGKNRGQSAFPEVRVCTPGTLWFVYDIAVTASDGCGGNAGDIFQLAV